MRITINWDIARSVRAHPLRLGHMYITGRVRPLQRAFNKYTRGGSASSWQDIARAVREEKLMIHDSQLCFNSNRRLVPSEGQPARRRGGRAVGRSGDKTSVSNARPRRGATGDIEAAGHRNTHVCVHAGARFDFINHCLLPKKLISCRPLGATHFLCC